MMQDYRWRSRIRFCENYTPFINHQDLK